MIMDHEDFAQPLMLIELIFMLSNKKVETHSVVLEEGGVKLSLTIVDTPGFGDKVTIVMMLMMLMTLVRTLATGCDWSVTPHSRQC